MLEEMKNGGYNLGGEQSGHALTDQSTTVRHAVCDSFGQPTDAQQGKRPASVQKKSIVIRRSCAMPVAPQYKTGYMKNAVVASRRYVRWRLPIRARALTDPPKRHRALVRIMIEEENQAASEADAKALAKIMEGSWHNLFSKEKDDEKNFIVFF